MTSTTPKYWFPAKQYGWGWGLPNTWQGWTVLAVFALLLAVSAIVFPPKVNADPFFACTLGLSIVLFGICYLKGEPTTWRWGKD
jgi:hypothetical protein